MSYDTLYFAVFLAAVWVAFRLLPWHGWTLLAASVVFYAAAGLRDTLLAAVIILANYLFQFLVLRDRRWLYAALAVDFGCLAYFKYRVFLATAAGLDDRRADTSPSRTTATSSTPQSCVSSSRIRDRSSRRRTIQKSSCIAWRVRTPRRPPSASPMRCRESRARTV